MGSIQVFENVVREVLNVVVAPQVHSEEKHVVGIYGAEQGLDVTAEASGVCGRDSRGAIKASRA